MSEITIHMRFNKETGRKELHVHYESDSDALPFEHEKRHREIVESLVGKGILRPDEVGQVVVKRVAQRTAEAVSEAQAEPRSAQRQGE